MKQKVKEPVMSQRAPASGGPSIDDMPRKQLIKPNIVDSVSIPNRSTNMMEVKDIYEAINRQKDFLLICFTFRSITE